MNPIKEKQETIDNTDKENTPCDLKVIFIFNLRNKEKKIKKRKNQRSLKLKVRKMQNNQRLQFL